MFYRWMRSILCLMADGGAGDGGSGDGNGSEGTDGQSQQNEGTEGAGTQQEGQSGSNEDNNRPMPKYFSQINPTKANSDEYKALYGYQKLEDLADAALQLKRENDALKQSNERTITVPKKDDAEGIKAFKSKLGIPENEDGYTLKNLDVLKVDERGRKAVAKIAYGAMLTDKQAEAVGASLAVLTKMSIEDVRQKQEERVKGFPEALKASYTSLQSDTDRQSAADKDSAAYSAFAEESGLKELLERTGMSYNTEFVKGIAAYARKHAGTKTPGNEPGSGKQSVKKSVYGSSFADYYGKKDN